MRDVRELVFQGGLRDLIWWRNQAVAVEYKLVDRGRGDADVSQIAL